MLFKILVFILFLFLNSSYAKHVGNIINATGRVDIVKKGHFLGKSYKFYKGKLEVGDLVRTKKRSFADIFFIDKTYLKLFENSRLWIKNYLTQKQIGLPYGKVLFEVTHQFKGKFKVTSSLSLTGVKGTKFIVYSRPNINVISVISGLVEVKPLFSSDRILLSKDQILFVFPDKSFKIFTLKPILEKVKSKKIKSKTTKKKIFKEKSIKQILENPEKLIQNVLETSENVKDVVLNNDIALEEVVTSDENSEIKLNIENVHFDTIHINLNISQDLPTEFFGN